MRGLVLPGIFCGMIILETPGDTDVFSFINIETGEYSDKTVSWYVLQKWDTETPPCIEKVHTGGGSWTV